MTLNYISEVQTLNASAKNTVMVIIATPRRRNHAAFTQIELFIRFHMAGLSNEVGKISCDTGDKNPPERRGVLLEVIRTVWVSRCIPWPGKELTPQSSRYPLQRHEYYRCSHVTCYFGTLICDPNEGGIRLHAYSGLVA